MAYDKIIDSAKLDAAVTASADAIRAKTGSTAKIAWNESTGFASAISAIESGGGKVATGSFYGRWNQAVTVSGLGFEPQKIIIYAMDSAFFGSDELFGDFDSQVLYADYDKNAKAPFAHVRVVYGYHGEDEDGICGFVLAPFQIGKGNHLIPTNDGFTADFTEYTPYLYTGTYNYIAIG